MTFLGVGWVGSPVSSAEDPLGRGVRCEVAAGSLIVKVDPLSCWLHTVTSPPWLATTCLTMLRPRPVPPVDRERAGSTR